jgi:hypothetical protein
MAVDLAKSRHASSCEPSPENLQEYKNKSYFLAIKILKRAELAEEISQDVLLHILEKKLNAPHIKYLTIDAIRRRFGKPGSARSQYGGFELFDGFRTAQDHAREIEQHTISDNRLDGTNALVGVELDRFIPYLSPGQLKLFKALRMGLKKSEYAKKIGVAPSSVSQMFLRAKRNIETKKLYFKTPAIRSRRNKPRRGQFVLKTDETIVVPLGRSLFDVERDYIIATLKACNDNRTHASEVLGISLRGLRFKLDVYGAKKGEAKKSYRNVKQKNIEQIVSIVLQELQPILSKHH